MYPLFLKVSPIIPNILPIIPNDDFIKHLKNTKRSVNAYCTVASKMPQYNLAMMITAAHQRSSLVKKTHAPKQRMKAVLEACAGFRISLTRGDLSDLCLTPVILAFPPIILVLCSMLLLTQNYAGIFRPGLVNGALVSILWPF